MAQTLTHILLLFPCRMHLLTYPVVFCVNKCISFLKCLLMANLCFQDGNDAITRSPLGAY